MTDQPLTPEERRKALEYVALKQKYRRIEYFEPYVKQRQFLELGLTKRERLFMAGNRCISPWTFIETASRPVLSADIFASADARVRSLVDGSECVVPARGGFLRGIEPAYRLVMASGQFFDCSATHRVSTEQGWISVSHLMLHASGLHCWQRAEDYQANCVADGYLCDPQLLLEEGIVRGRLRVPAGALNNSLSFSREDAEERGRKCTSFSQRYDLLTSLGELLPHADLYAQFAAPFSSSPVLSLNDCILELLRSILASDPNEPNPKFSHAEFLSAYPTLCVSSRFDGAGDRLARNVLSDRGVQRSLDASSRHCSLPELHRDAQHTAIFYPLSHLPLVGGAKIIAVVPIGYQPILDIQVPGVNSYLAAGVLHHNCGKTETGAYEAALHATGDYPSDWKGKRFDRPTIGWVAGQTSLAVRDICQAKLLGSPGVVSAQGTGMLPKEAIVDTSLARGVTDAIDTVQVRYTSGGVSIIRFKSYEQGRAKFQGEGLDWFWGDEEMPIDIYSEALTRIGEKNGIAWITFTPLLGRSAVVLRFLDEPSPDRHVVSMTLDDIPPDGHISIAQRQKIIEGYLPHEREARARGIPILGSGRIFTTPEAAIVEAPIEHIPAYWKKLWGIDIGIGHPFAAVLILWDVDNDCIHIHQTYRISDTIPLVHATAMRKIAAAVPVAYPKDADDRDRGTGEPVSELYKDHGLILLPEHATWPDGSMSTEAGILEWDERERTGRLKVAAHLSDWLEERRFYHRKDGQIVKIKDDLMSATRIALMMKRFARAVGLGGSAPPRSGATVARNVDFDLFAGGTDDPFAA